MNTRYLIAASLLAVYPLQAQDAEDVTKLLAQLQSADVEIRLEAIRELQTSLDPRIPDACLPLFKLEGNTVKRLAARAIGSRWHQIPKERVAVFTAALKAQLTTNKYDGTSHMALRGLALLERKYTPPMVSQSRNKRWVVYERYGLPCLIETKTMTEELLGFPDEAKMLCAYGNSELAPTVHWHPKKDMFAITMIEDRHHTSVWVWVHGKGLRNLSSDDLFAKAARQGELAGVTIYGDVAGWAGDDLDLTLNYSARKGEEVLEHDARLRWNTATEKLTLLSDKVAP